MGNKTMANHIEKSKLVEDIAASSRHVFSDTRREMTSPITAGRIIAVRRLRRERQPNG